MELAVLGIDQSESAAKYRVGKSLVPTPVISLLQSNALNHSDQASIQYICLCIHSVPFLKIQIVHTPPRFRMTYPDIENGSARLCCYNLSIFVQTRPVAAHVHTT